MIKINVKLIYLLLTMGKLYKPVMKNTCLRNFLIQTNVLETIKKLKYKTLEKEKNYVHHYGWHNCHLYGIGVYQLNNGIKINFDYCYEMDIKNIHNIKKVISCKLEKIDENYYKAY